MSRATSCLVVLGGTLVLASCAAPPPGPSVMVLPGQGKSFDQFQRDDAMCRQYADQQTGYGASTAAVNQAGVGSAVLGTGLGAAAGALLGAASGHAGAGAAIGAGSGLLLGSAIGANNTAAGGAGIQAHYNMAYSQCMVANGNRLPGSEAPPYPYAGGPPPYYPPGGPGPDPYASAPPPGPYGNPPPPPNGGQGPGY